MSQKNLENFQPYQKAQKLYDLVVKDLDPLSERPKCWRLISQQVANVGSIAANIEEGYGRDSSKEYRHFLIIARGSAREPRGCYTRTHHWISAAETINERTAYWTTSLAFSPRSSRI